MGKRIRTFGGLQWPPRGAAEMQAWQRLIGSDLAIARALGMNRASVYGLRRKHAVTGLPAKRRGRVREHRPRARLSALAICRLYAGRRYEDRAIRPACRGVPVRAGASRVAPAARRLARAG